MNKKLLEESIRNGMSPVRPKTPMGYLTPHEPNERMEEDRARGRLSSFCEICGHHHIPVVPGDYPRYCINWLLQDRDDLERILLK